MEKRAWLTLSVHAFHVCVMHTLVELFPVRAKVMIDFSSGVNYALQCLGSPDLCLKMLTELIASIKYIYKEKDVFRSYIILPGLETGVIYTSSCRHTKSEVGVIKIRSHSYHTTPARSRRLM